MAIRLLLLSLASPRSQNGLTPTRMATRGWPVIGGAFNTPQKAWGGRRCAFRLASSIDTQLDSHEDSGSIASPLVVAQTQCTQSDNHEDSGSIVSPLVVTQTLRTMRFVGHRGRSATEAENSRLALELALSVSDGTEVDVHATLDGELVVLHDATLQRTGLAWHAAAAEAAARGRGDGHHLAFPDADAYHRAVTTPVADQPWSALQHVRVATR